MNNIDVKYLLGLLLIFIWGLLCYRVYLRMEPPTSTMSIKNNRPNDTLTLKELDTFYLALNYSDPFFKDKKSVSAKKKQLSNKVNLKLPLSKKKEKKKEKPNLPLITYKGTIQVKNKELVAILSIDSKILHLKEGEKFRDIGLKKIHIDSIQIKFYNESFTILKEI